VLKIFGNFVTVTVAPKSRETGESLALVLEATVFKLTAAWLELFWFDLLLYNKYAVNRTWNLSINERNAGETDDRENPDK